jgi:hypothetical protein
MTLPVVPCPTCWLLADLRHAEPMSESLCPRGHRNTLAPVVLVYLLALLGPAFDG